MRRCYIVIVALLVCMLSGCSSKASDDAYKIYYLNLDLSSMDTVDYVPSSDVKDSNSMVGELLEKLQTNPENDKMIRTIPDSIDILGYEIEEESKTLSINFSSDYNKLIYKMTSGESVDSATITSEPASSEIVTQEVLIRAAIVRTLVQIPDIHYVEFYIDNKILTFPNGREVTSMNAESFVENPGAQINSSQEARVKLYFADQTGTRLIEQERAFKYSSNKSLEKVVMEKLIEGPKSSSQLATVPSGTKLININVVDRICYVNLDETFINNQNEAVTEEVVLYSIVDSLTSLAGVDQVQIQINGNTNGKVRYNYDLANFYSKDTSLLEPTMEVSTETEIIEEENY